MTSTGSAPSPPTFGSLWSPTAADDSFSSASSNHWPSPPGFMHAKDAAAPASIDTAWPWDAMGLTAASGDAGFDMLAGAGAGTDLSSASPSPPAFLLDATFAPQPSQRPTTSFTGVIPDINVSAYASPPMPLTTAFNPPPQQQPQQQPNGSFASRFGGMGTDSPFGVAPPGYEATAPLQQPYSLVQPQQPMRPRSLSPKSMALQPAQMAQFAQPVQLGIPPVGATISGEAKRRRVSVADIGSVAPGNVGMIANAGMNRRSSGTSGVNRLRLPGAQRIRLRTQLRTYARTGPSLAPPALALSLNPSNITVAPAKPAPLKRKASEEDDDDDGPTGHNAVEKRYRNKINTVRRTDA